MMNLMRPIILNPSVIVKPCQQKNVQKCVQNDNIYCVYNTDAISIFTPDMLSSHYWQKKEAITGTAQGRGTTYFIHYQKSDWVLRHYYRGGLIGKINNDSYFFTQYKKTRAAKEYQLLTKLAELDLPAPKPIAYRVIKNGLFYHADILTSRINNATDLVDILQKKPLNEIIWQKIGVMIKQFHQHGIYHHDLNSHNILLDQQSKPWLIDFDQGEQRSIKQSWQENNLNRLLRSFHKEKNKLERFHWQEENWQHLLQGYNQLT